MEGEGMSMKRRDFLHAGAAAAAAGFVMAGQCAEESLAADALLDAQAEKAFAWFVRYREDATGLVLDRGRNTRVDYPRPELATIAGGGYYLSFLPEAVRRGWISRDTARRQAEITLRYALEQLPHDRGFFYHFYHARTGRASRGSEISVLDTAIFLNGVMVAGGFFADTAEGENGELAPLADALLDRVQWPVLEMTVPGSDRRALSMAIHTDGKLGWQMDVRSSEFLMAYFLAVGSRTHPVDAELWYACRLVRGKLPGQRREILNPRFPLFTSYYSLAWQDLAGYTDRDGVSMFDNARQTALANRDFCAALAERHATFAAENGGWWGLSAGDSPKGYVAQGPTQTADGTVWPLTALAALTLIPETLKADILRWHASEAWAKIDGPYGLAPFNLEQKWIARDILAIDAGSFLLDWANHRHGTIHTLWMRHPVAQNGLERLSLKKE